MKLRHPSQKNYLLIKCLLQGRFGFRLNPPAPICKTRIKLSNALEFANNELPCFVVLFHYNKKGNRQYIYACHFWKDLIERSLKRGRTVSVDGKPTNQSMMSISFTDQDDHSSDLIEWITNTVNALPIGYSSISNDETWRWVTWASFASYGYSPAVEALCQDHWSYHW